MDDPSVFHRIHNTAQMNMEQMGAIFERREDLWEYWEDMQPTFETVVRLAAVLLASSIAGTVKREAALIRNLVTAANDCFTEIDDMLRCESFGYLVNDRIEGDIQKGCHDIIAWLRSVETSFNLN